MDHYQFYAVLTAAATASLVPAHWGLPVVSTYPKDDGNRDIIFGGYNRDIAGNLIDWRRPTWQEAVDGVAGVHDSQMGPQGRFIYTYGDLTTEVYLIAKFVYPHLPAAHPLVSGGNGLFSLLNNPTLSDASLVIDATIQEVIDDKKSLYCDAKHLLAWITREEQAGNLVRGLV